MQTDRAQYTYSLNCGQYVLMHGNKPIARVMDALSFAIDIVEGNLAKYGDPEQVQAWYAREVVKMRQIGWDEQADALVVVTGRFPLDEVNAMMLNRALAGLFYQRLVGGEINELPYAN